MDRIKTRIIIAVAERLSAAKDSNAKTDLIEELSENLYQRYADLAASGVSEEEAYQRAMEDLGDVSELLEYLDVMEGTPAQPQRSARDFMSDFIRGFEEVMRETVSQTKDAVEQAKVITRDFSRKMQEKYPDGFDKSFSCGYDKERGGFFWESSRKGTPVVEESIPAENVISVKRKKDINAGFHVGSVRPAISFVRILWTIHVQWKPNHHMYAMPAPRSACVR